MGRKKSAVSRSVDVHLRLLPAEVRLFTKAAKKNEMTLSAWIRSCARVISRGGAR
jgi:hypothetical protein